MPPRLIEQGVAVCICCIVEPLERSALDRRSIDDPEISCRRLPASVRLVSAGVVLRFTLPRVVPARRRRIPSRNHRKAPNWRPSSLGTSAVNANG
jgi:hypothetical protein